MCFKYETCGIKRQRGAGRKHNTTTPFPELMLWRNARTRGLQSAVRKIGLYSVRF